MYFCSLIQDGAAAIWLYTVEGSLYKQLNATLRDRDRNSLKKFYFPYIRILLEALKALQKKEKQTLNRGVKKALVTMHPHKYEKDMNLIWWSFTSTTRNVKVMQEK